MDRLIEILAQACIVGNILIGIIITLVFMFTKICPHCKGSRRIWKNGVDYICPTCKGTGTIVK